VFGMRSRVAPTVSVMIPAFNVAPYLEAALRSICMQTYQDLEVVVVDDGSSDDTGQIAEAYPDDRVVVHREASRQGVAAARNRCVSLARGRLFAWMDGDDISLPARLAQQVAFLETNPEVSVVGTDVIPMDTSSRRYGTPWVPPSDPGVIEWGLLFGTPVVNGTTMVRREVYEGASGYNEELPVAEDYEFWLRQSRSIRLANLNKVLLVYRRHGGNTTLMQRRSSTQESIRLTAEALSDLIGSEVTHRQAGMLRRPRLITEEDVVTGEARRAVEVLDQVAWAFDKMRAHAASSKRALKRERSLQRVYLAEASLRRSGSHPRLAVKTLTSLHYPADLLDAGLSFVVGRLKRQARRSSFRIRHKDKEFR
jgi:hypothetical protein